MNCKYKNCTNEANDSKICPHCCRFMYCSDQCLRLDWETHKYSCAPHVFILKDLLPIKKSSKSLLGKGAYGEVQLVQHVRSKALFALKIIKKETLHHTPIEIFLREISVHKSLVHQNIARLYDHLEDKRKIYLILEYVEKGSIAALLKKKVKLSELEVCDLFKQACVGVGFLHENNIIHRDIKSENLLINKDGVVKLCDFGWCAYGIQPRSTFCGTADYMAPEMSQSESYNNKVDIWALGILLYELLHGRTPFFSVNIFNKFKEGLGKLEFRSDLSLSCKNLIIQILDENPNSRPTIKEILKSSWFAEYNICKFRVGDVLKHSELGDGAVVQVEGNICKIEFAKLSLEFIDTEAAKVFELKSARNINTKSQEVRNKPPLSRNSIKNSPKLTLKQATSEKNIRAGSPIFKRRSAMNTSIESLMVPKPLSQRRSSHQSSYHNLNDISSISPIRSRENSPSRNIS